MIKQTFPTRRAAELFMIHIRAAGLAFSLVEAAVMQFEVTINKQTRYTPGEFTANDIRDVFENERDPIALAIAHAMTHKNDITPLVKLALYLLDEQAEQAEQMEDAA